MPWPCLTNNTKPITQYFIVQWIWNRWKSKSNEHKAQIKDCEAFSMFCFIPFFCFCVHILEPVWLNKQCRILFICVRMCRKSLWFFPFDSFLCFVLDCEIISSFVELKAEKYFNAFCSVSLSISSTSSTTHQTILSLELWLN